MRFPILLAALLLSSHVLAGESEPAVEPEACPPVTAEDIETRKRAHLEERRRTERVTANVGVDALGRVLLAIDLDRDGMADDIVLFTAESRLEGPWSQFVRSADYEVTRGTLRLEASDGSLALALAVAPADLPSFRRKVRKDARVLRESGGMELAVQQPGAESRQRLESYDHTLIESWPPSFRTDFHAPGTSIGVGQGPDNCYNCVQTNCQTGGCFTESCGRDCTGIATKDRCQIGCTGGGTSFACCNCTNGIFFPIASCRCIPCRRLLGPIP